MTGRRPATAGVAILASLGLLFGGPAPAARGTMSNSRSVGSNTIATGRVFSGARTSSAWTVSDASSGTAATQNDVLSYAGDSRTKTTGAWASTFSSTRYFELAFHPVLAPGVAVATILFNFNYRPSATSSNACFYFDVRTASTSTVLATYGSSGSPVGCNATTTLSSTSTSIPIVTSTTQANDLAVRVYMTNSGTTKTAIIDRATVSGTTALQSFTLFEKQSVDASTGTAVTTVWPWSTNDTTVYTSASVFTTAFAATRFLSLTFPANLPSGATVTDASLTRIFRTATASDSLCWYLDVLNGASLIGTHGSTGSPISCATSNSAYTTNTVTLSEISTAAIANSVVVKLYNKSSLAGKSVDTMVSLSVTWSMP